jgi:hypothetical protein
VAKSREALTSEDWASEAGEPCQFLLIAVSESMVDRVKAAIDYVDPLGQHTTYIAPILKPA